MRETAYAKINLALHVRGREPDGYHRIETLFAFAESGDTLTVEESGGLSLHIEGPFAGLLPPSEDNIIVQAVEALRSRYGPTRGAKLRLDKQLPVAAGIGGGSADAAAALRLMTRWWNLPDDPAALVDIGRELGADVPACVRSQLCRGQGRGDLLQPLEDDSVGGMALLLVNPRIPVSTGAVFQRWNGFDRGPLPEGTAIGAALEARNDLEAPAREVAPVIDELLHALRSCDDVVLARMSGSGATCFALFGTDEARDVACRAIEAEHPDWWTLATQLRQAARPGE